MKKPSRIHTNDSIFRASSYYKLSAEVMSVAKSAIFCSVPANAFKSRDKIPLK